MFLAQSDDDELHWLHRGYPDNTDLPAVVDVGKGHGRAVAFHEKGFSLGFELTGGAKRGGF